MSDRVLRLITSFPAGILERCLLRSGIDRSLKSEVFHPGAPTMSSEQDRDDCCLYWLLAEATLPTVALALQGGEPTIADLDSEVDTIADQLLEQAGRCRRLVMVSWTTPIDGATHGLLDARPAGLSGLIWRANLRLCERLASASNTFLLPCDAWLRAGGAAPSDSRLRLATGIPFTNAVFTTAAEAIAAAVDVDRAPRKLIVLDLDETLWGGIVGETGWQGITLGGHDLRGAAFRAFQSALKALQRRGVLLAVASRNDESTALEAIDRHPEMILRREDFAAWRIGFGDKAAAIAQMLEELRLGSDAFVFIDDQPAERARVRACFPDAIVPEWPADPALAIGALHALRCFDTPARSDLDRHRTRLYTEERARTSLRQTIGSEHQWRAALELKVEMRELDVADVSRAAQLMSRTNQMNLTTRRLAESDLRTMIDREGVRIWTARVRDRFGDSGISGVVSVSFDVARRLLTVTDFLMSCRVMNRRVEWLMLETVRRCASELGATGGVQLGYCATERNRPLLDFLQALPAERSGDDFLLSIDATLLEAHEAEALIIGRAAEHVQ